MSKKINIATINPVTLENLSLYHKAYKVICKLDAQKKSELKANKEAMEKYMKEHDPEKEKDYSLDKFVKEEGRIQAWYKEKTDPLKENQQLILKEIDKDIYYAYSIAMLKGTLSARGKIEIGNTGNKTFTVEKSYSAQIKSFLESMGCGSTENETALNKAAQSIAIRCGGMMKDNKGDYLKLRNVSNFRNILVLAFLQYAIIDRKALIVNEDNSLSLNKGEDK